MSEEQVVQKIPILRTRQSLAKDLKQLGLDKGMIVIVHSSLSSLGWVCGGPVAVIQALMDVVTFSGTIVMPTQSTDYSDPALWSNPPVPQEWWPIIGETMPAYEPNITPTRGVGIIAETFRKWPGVLRSSHPALSFGAWGKYAEKIIKDHSLDNGLGENSLLARIYDLDGWVLLLGVGYDRNTSFHLAEYGVLIICGSPRKGGNTELLLSFFEKELQQHGIQTEFTTLAEKEIKHCINCDKCIDTNKCIQKDDFNNIYNKVLENEGLVVGSPVYVGTPTSLLMAFLQRLTYVSWNNNRPLAKKIGGPIAVAGETGQLATINCLIDFYLVNEMVIPSSYYWNAGVGCGKGDILNDEKGKSYVVKFAQNMAWLMKKLEEEVK